MMVTDAHRQLTLPVTTADHDPQARWIDQGGGAVAPRLLPSDQSHRAGASRRPVLARPGFVGRPDVPPTLADVAQHAGVSRQTVSNAVNNPDLLRPTTLVRVQAAIAELGYSPNRAARNLRTQASHLIGLRFSPAQEGTANALMDRFVHTLVETSPTAGYHVLLFAGDPIDPEVGYDELVRSNAVDAFVVTDTYLGSPQVPWLIGRGIPFVAFGRPWDHDESSHPWIDVDGAAGAAMATEHLLDRGHQRIAWIGWRRDSRIGEDRRSGWLRAMHDRGLSTTGLASRVEDSVWSGSEATAVLLDEAHPTAFVCASDTLAMGVFHTLNHRGLRPGHDLAVVGFDDSQVAQVVPPGLTSVRQPLEQVALEVVRALEGLLGHPRRTSKGVLLTPTLTVRGSSSYGRGDPSLAD
jgi:DNA-binding LacI/PurR family transcriptional regulator